MDSGDVELDTKESKYRSRKFIVTSFCVMAGVGMAFIGKLTPELSNVILSALASYNVSNAWMGRK